MTKRKTEQLTEAEQAYNDRIARKYQEYEENFDLEGINAANDRALLNILINQEVIVESLQTQMSTIVIQGGVLSGDASDLKKLADLLRDATSTITSIQKTLGIDRKARRSEQEESPADYVKRLLESAKNFSDKKIKKLYCPRCNIMVGRYAPVHDHTEFSVAYQCSQCNKHIRASRKGKDVLFDVKDASWRRKYKAEVVLPKKASHRTYDEDLELEDLTLNPGEVDLQKDTVLELERDDDLST